MPSANEAAPMNEVGVAPFRKDDFAELEAWATEVGLTADELSEQILKMTARFRAMRGKPRVNNVLPFAAPR